MTLQEISNYLVFNIQIILSKLSDWSIGSNFIYPVLLSLISALIFWITFSYYPEKKRGKKIRPIVELDFLNIYNSLFSIFDTIMKHQENSPSEYQSVIRSGALSLNDIKLGIQNKCLNSNYLYDENVNPQLIIIGKSIYESSVHIDYLVDKIISFSQYTSAEEILLLEEIRTELRKYDFGDENIEKNPGSSIAGKIYLPTIPIIYYRVKNFYDLYELFLKLQQLVLKKNRRFDRNIFIYKMQYLFHSKSYKKCKKFIDKNKVKFKKEANLFNNYYALCEYNLGNKSRFYSCIDSIYKDRPYRGSLVSSRETLKDFVTDKKVIEILARYHSKEEIEKLEAIVKEDIKRKDTFIKNNRNLSEYFSTIDTRLTPVATL